MYRPPFTRKTCPVTYPAAGEARNATAAAPSSGPAPPLRRRVGDLPGIANLRDDRGEVDDPPVAAADHGPERRLAGVEYARQVGSQDPLPVLLPETEEERIHRQPRVIDENINSSQPVNDAQHAGARRRGG